MDQHAKAKPALIRISAPHFCAAVEVGTGWCAPILSYMRNWTEERITNYAHRKGWTAEVIERGH